jgi:phosphopantothenoylcysteine decarboxylase/phosphopantothenate--cysteine ligase
MHVLITAGPTHEPIDPVRYIANRSSGKMGYALAEAAMAAGHAVTLVSGPVALKRPPGLRKFIAVKTADEMYDAVHANTAKIDLAMLCAAVADFKMRSIRTRKIKKRGRAKMTIELVATRDILASLANRKKNFSVVGFAAETNDVIKNARKKLREKNCDAIVSNDVSRMNTGFASDYNAVTVLFRDDRVIKIPRARKSIIAARLIALFAPKQKL